MDLPQDLVANILLRFPLKILCKMKCVSKQWRHIISELNFQGLHDELSKKRPKLLYAIHPASHLSPENPNYTCQVTISSFDFFSGNIQNRFVLPIRDYSYSLVTKHGILCLFSETSIHICNPSTQEFIKLPDSPFPRIRYGEALGYEPISKVYKVVIFDKGEENIRACIHSVSNMEPISDCWREIGNLPRGYSSFTSPICVEGVIYWFVNDRKQPWGWRKRICSFNLKDEYFQTIEIPPGISISYSIDSAMMVSLKGSLGFVLQKHQSDVLNVWLLREDKEWMKEYEIDPMRLGYHCKILGFIPRSLDNEEDMLIWMSFKFMCYYNVASKSFQRVDQIDVPKYRTPCFYTDSFFSLRSHS